MLPSACGVAQHFQHLNRSFLRKEPTPSRQISCLFFSLNVLNQFFLFQFRLTLKLSRWSSGDQSICQPTIGCPIYSRHSTAAVYGPADSRSMVGCYTADISSTEHRHTTDVSSTLVLHAVDSSLDCCQFWMFGGFLLSKCLYSVKSQRDATISWNLFASFSRLFPVSTLTRAPYSFCFKLCCYPANKL